MNRKNLALSGLVAVSIIILICISITNRTEIQQNPAFSSQVYQQDKYTNISKSLVPALALASGKNDTSYHFKNGKDRYLAELSLGIFVVGFDNEGVELTSSSESDGFTMNLSAVGYGDEITLVSEAEAIHNANLIEYRRGNLIEWYINSPLGLEQGFTLMTRPYKNEDNGALRLLIDINSDEELKTTLHGGTVKLAKGGWSNAVQYGGLYAFDSSGKELPSELRLRDGGIEILVEDKDAVYPIVVDPFINVAKLTDPDPDANDEGVSFGNGVAIDEDIAIVGAPFRDLDGVLSPGAAFVFERDGSGMWNFMQMLTASDGFAGHEFGWEVSLDGDRVLIGARQGGAGGDTGAAYIFERGAMGVWNEEQILTPSDGVPFDFFGVDLALDGDRAVIASPNDDIGGNISQGSAYVFERDAMGNWVEVIKLTASDGAAIDSFGSGTGISGDTVIVGAQGHNASMGAAYVFVRDNMGAWNETQKLTASDAAIGIGDAFGSELFVDGDTAAINAFLAEGASYIFERDEMGMWSETQILTPSDANTAFAFGEVAIDGDRLIMSGGSLNSVPGSAYIFERNAMGLWEEVQIIDPGDDGGAFGLSVSINGDRIIAGAPRDELGTDEFKGSAHIFELDSDGDGVPDDIDECSDSDLSETVVIDGCDSGVENVLVEDGCTISDLIAEIAGGAKNHGKFVSGVSKLLNQLKKAGIISGSDKGAIQSCAAMADIP